METLGQDSLLEVELRATILELEDKDTILVEDKDTTLEMDKDTILEVVEVRATILEVIPATL